MCNDIIDHSEFKFYTSINYYILYFLYYTSLTLEYKVKFSIVLLLKSTVWFIMLRIILTITIKRLTKKLFYIEFFS